jgi:SEC-C motif-containing protein
MRSRYTAYVMGLSDYLIHTWHPSTRPGTLSCDDEPIAWLGLKVARCESPGPDRASVEFIARYKVRGRAHRLHEISRFVREDGRWFYVDGVFPEA